MITLEKANALLLPLSLRNGHGGRS
jgi:hypothetical protein